MHAIDLIICFGIIVAFAIVVLFVYMVVWLLYRLYRWVKEWIKRR